MKTQLIVLLLLAAGTAMAQQENEERRQPPSAADFVARLDQDGDGKVSSSEFDGPSEHFSKIDKNEDGYLSEDEAPTGPPPREQHPEGDKGEKEQRPPRSEGGEDGGFISRLDQDGDGKVSSSEFDGPSEHFSKIDKNEDGYLSEDEAPTGPPPRKNR